MPPRNRYAFKRTRKQNFYVFLVCVFAPRFLRSFCFSIAFRIALTKRSNRKSCLFSKDKSRLICFSMYLQNSRFDIFVVLFFGNYFLNRFTWKAARQRLCGGRVFAVCGRRYWWCFCLTWFARSVYVYAWLSVLFFFFFSRIFLVEDLLRWFGCPIARIRIHL